MLKPIQFLFCALLCFFGASKAHAVMTTHGQGSWVTGANVATSLGWRSHYIDATGLYYMGARYYAPDSGTFLSPDPLGHAASWDLYSYCNGDPINNYDPDGRFGKGAAAGWSGSIASGDPNSAAFYAGTLIGGTLSGAGSGLDQAYGHGTISIGPVISGNIGVQFNASLQVSFSNLNNPENRSIGILISSVPYTGVSSGVGLSFGGLFSKSSASSPEQLNGWSGTAGGSIDAGIAFGYDRGGWGTADKTAPSIDSYFLGLGAKISPEFVVPLPAEGHVNSTWSYEKSIPLFR